MRKKIKGFNNSLKRVVSSAFFTVTLATLSTPASAATLNVQTSGQDKILLGASGINVSGKLYDVEFRDATFDSIFDTSPLTFTDSNSARQASQALLDQVLIDSPQGLFDSFNVRFPNGDFAFGCTPDLYCVIWTPYARSGALLLAVSAVNGPGTGVDFTSFSNYFTRSLNLN